MFVWKCEVSAATKPMGLQSTNDGDSAIMYYLLTYWYLGVRDIAGAILRGVFLEDCCTKMIRPRYGE